MSSLTPSKRQHSQNPTESNGKKLHKTESRDSLKEARQFSTGNVVFRILCASSKVESVISKEENIISLIHQGTAATIKIEDYVPGCEERVISVMDMDPTDADRNEQPKTDNEDSKSINEKGGSADKNVNDAEKKTFQRAEDSHSERGSSSVQKALLSVFEKFFEEEERDDGKEENNEPATVTLRLLVLSSQVGCILGKGGSVVKQLCVDSGAQIRVLPRDKLPQCASSEDEVVQIIGAADAVKKAIKSISDQILERPPRDHDSLSQKPSKTSSNSYSNPVSRPGFHRPMSSQGPPFGSGFHDGAVHPNAPSLYPMFHENRMPSHMDISDMLTFRVLCPDERMGGVIGKGGAIIKTLKHETGCEIKALKATSDGEEREIVVSGPAHPDDRISAVQDAVLRVQHRIAKAIPDNKEKGVTAKLIVSTNQIGCLLGTGGSIIAEMRKVTGAHIRILGKDQNPKFLSENEEVVQINGELEMVQEAILQITTRLQHHFFRDAFPSINHPSNPAFLDGALPLPFMGRRELSPSRMYPNLGPPFESFDSMGGPPHARFHLHDDHPPFMHGVHRQGISHISERPWHPQNLFERNPMGLMDYDRAPQKSMSGFGGESQQAMITNTTVDVVVPSSAVPSIYGQHGGCLRQIRQISQAKITITEAKPGAADTLVVISGTPEQTHAAQSLVHAFVMLENEATL